MATRYPEYQKEWRVHNKEKIKAYKRKHYIKNKESIAAKNRARHEKYRIESPWMMHYIDAKQRCNNPSNDSYEWYGGKGIEFLLCMEEVKFLYIRDRASEMEWSSIDRIDRNDNYYFGNCRFIEQRENNSTGPRRKHSGLMD